MTQRSSFVLNMCLWLLPHLQFLFSTLEHLKSLGFISIHSLPCRATISFIIFIFLSFFLHFVRTLEFVQCIINLIFYSVYSVFYYYAILSCYAAFGVLKVISSLRNFPSHLIQCLWLDFLLLFQRDGVSYIPILMIPFSKILFCLLEEIILWGLFLL